MALATAVDTIVRDRDRAPRLAYVSEHISDNALRWLAAQACTELNQLNRPAPMNATTTPEVGAIFEMGRADLANTLAVAVDRLAMAHWTLAATWNFTDDEVADVA